MIRKEEDVEKFLQQFKPKFKIWGVIFVGREKNNEALKLLGISPIAREEIIESIEKVDYVDTIENAIPYGELWVFGKDLDGTELYIKISMGQPNNKTICISFHIAEHPMKYPYK